MIGFELAAFASQPSCFTFLAMMGNGQLLGADCMPMFMPHTGLEALTSWVPHNQLFCVLPTAGMLHIWHLCRQASMKYKKLEVFDPSQPFFELAWMSISASTIRP